MVLLALHVLVNLGDTFIDVPEHEHAETCGSCCLTIVLALEHPVILVLVCQDEQIFAKAGIDEGINVGERQVLLCTVNILILEASVLQVGLVNRVRMLGLHHVEVAGQRLKVLAKLLVGNDVLQVFIFALVGVPLSCKKECKLLERDWVLALGHDLADELHIVHFLGHSHGLRIPLELAVDVVRCAERMLHLLSVG